MRYKVYTFGGDNHIYLFGGKFRAFCAQNHVCQFKNGWKREHQSWKNHWNIGSFSIAPNRLTWHQNTMLRYEVISLGKKYKLKSKKKNLCDCLAQLLSSYLSYFCRFLSEILSIFGKCKKKLFKKSKNFNPLAASYAHMRSQGLKQLFYWFFKILKLS